MVSCFVLHLTFLLVSQQNSVAALKYTTEVDFILGL